MVLVVVDKDGKRKSSGLDAAPKALETLFGKAANTLPPPPISLDAETLDLRQAKDQENRRARLAKGRNSTVLTGSLGLSNTAAVKRKTLLGQ